jgi:hypothetical protein
MGLQPGAVGIRVDETVVEAVLDACAVGRSPHQPAGEWRVGVRQVDAPVGKRAKQSERVCQQQAVGLAMAVAGAQRQALGQVVHARIMARAYTARESFC